MTQRTRKVLLLSLITVMMTLFLPIGVLAENIIFICNKSVTESKLTKSELKKIFLGKKIKWRDNKRINIVILTKGQLHKQFVRKFTQKSESQYTNYWLRMIFTGKSSLPRSFNTEKELINYVANTNGAIGYISAEKLNNTVNIITISSKQD